MVDKNKRKKGQIVLFVVVLLTIALIIVTSVLSRSLTSIKNTNINTDSTRAFNAAESGLEELLNRSDLATIANSGQVQDTLSVDPSTFSERNYKATFTDTGFFETRDIVAKDAVIQIDFISRPTNLAVYFKQPACVLLSAINLEGSLSRYFFCASSEDNFSNFTNASTGGVCSSSPGSSDYDACTGAITFPNPGTPYALLIKVLNSDSKIRVTADDYASTFITKNITGTAWATTKSGVKKELEAVTKTTKDIYPVFDYALYLR